MINKDIADKLMKAFDNPPETIQDGEKIVNGYLIYRAASYIEKLEKTIQLVQDSPAGKIVLDELRRKGKIKC